jgi:hypothetical protein
MDSLLSAPLCRGGYTVSVVGMVELSPIEKQDRYQSYYSKEKIVQTYDATATSKAAPAVVWR